MSKKLKLIISILLALAIGYGLFIYPKPNEPKERLTPEDLKNQELEKSRIELEQKSEDFFQAMKTIKETDSDFDGILDVDEAKYGTSPDSVDTDQDGLLDKDEILYIKTDPTKADTDGDGYSDGEEVRSGNNPLGPGKL